MQRNLILAIFCAGLLVSVVHSFSFDNNEENSGVFGKLKSGLKLAGKLLGLDAASEVAKLVTESFSKSNPKNKGDTAGSTGSTIFNGFFRLLGLESTKIGAIAVNAIVFLAQIISSSLSRPAPPELIHARKISSGTPFDWLSNNPSIKEVMDAAKDPNLAGNLIDNLKERTTDEQTGCVQLLICKAAPFLRGMQKALEKNNGRESGKTSGVSKMYQFLPNMEEVADNGDVCEENFPTCYLD